MLACLITRSRRVKVTGYPPRHFGEITKETVLCPYAVLAEYGYDPFGRRIWKEVDNSRTYFLYSDEGLIGEYDDTGGELRTYGYLPGSRWTSNPLFQKSEGQYYWYLNDHLGTPQKIIDETGTVVWSAQYDSFGNAQLDTSTITNNIGFPGQYWDDESGLYYNWNRYYDPLLGRYLRADPLGLDAGINYYVYVGNNPLGFVDYDGLSLRGAGTILRDTYVTTIANPINTVLNAPQNAFNAGLNWVNENVSLGDQIAIEQAIPATKLPFAAIASTSKVEKVVNFALKTFQSLGKTKVDDVVSSASKGGALVHLGEQGVAKINLSPVSKPQRIQGPWTQRDLARANEGKGPLDFIPTNNKAGREVPLELHHADQMPGAAIHEVPPFHSKIQGAHPNKYNQGVTPKMRQEDAQLHWYLRGKEMGN